MALIQFRAQSWDPPTRPWHQPTELDRSTGQIAEIPYCACISTMPATLGTQATENRKILTFQIAIIHAKTDFMPRSQAGQIVPMRSGSGILQRYGRPRLDRPDRRHSAHARHSTGSPSKERGNQGRVAGPAAKIIVKPNVVCIGVCWLPNSLNDDWGATILRIAIVDRDAIGGAICNDHRSKTASSQVRHAIYQSWAFIRRFCCPSGHQTETCQLHFPPYIVKGDAPVGLRIS